MRRVAATSLIAVLATLGATDVAHADTPGCVSQHEYHRIAKGMTMTKVHQIFDTAGAATGLGGENHIYYYRTCARLSQVQVTFSPRHRVVTKSANWYR